MLAAEYDTEIQKKEAMNVLHVLDTAYPNHPWAVLVRGGVIFIRHLAPDATLNVKKGWGMNIRFSEVNHDSAVLKRKIILLAGEFLERAGLVRGRENGDEIARVEGVPLMKEVEMHKSDFPVFVDTSGNPIRTEARPQALRMAAE